MASTKFNMSKNSGKATSQASLLVHPEFEDRNAVKGGGGAQNPSLPRRVGVLVLGMHRSGTSALTRMISLLGADLPSNIMPACEGNITGFWESTNVLQVNDGILASGGSQWADWRRFNPAWIRSPAKEPQKARALEIFEKDFGQSPIFVLKDPRICRILPFWLEVLRDFQAETKCVLPIRHPLEVAASLKRRDGFTPAKSLVLWLRHVLDAELGTRGMQRSLISYDELLNDWRGVASRLSDELQIAWPRWSATSEVEIDGFIEPLQRHHTARDAHWADHSELTPWLKEAYSALLDLKRQPESKRTLARLDAVRVEFDRVCDVIGTVARSEEVAREEAERETMALKRTVAEWEQRVELLTQDVKRRDAQTGTLTQTLADRDRQFERKVQNAASLSQALAQRDEKILSLEQSVTDANSLIAEFYASKSWRLTAPLRLMRRSLGRVFSRRGHGMVSADESSHADGIDPYTHYAKLGRESGRLGALNLPLVQGDLGHLAEQRATVLVVSHDASRTGAPILALNICQRIRDRYNVVALLLGGGELVANFEKECDVVIGPFEQLRNHFIASTALSKLLQDVKLEFAIVNSIESRHVLQSLARLFVPTLMLIHEFASYTRPRHAILEAALWASKIIFSAVVVADNAQHECRALQSSAPTVIPQGRSQIPVPVCSPEEYAYEKAKVKDLIRPTSLKDGTVIILGAGTVQLRKGVDLFLACASRVRELSPRHPFRFVWVGHGFAPDHDVSYSVYLQDQYNRSDLAEISEFVDELTHIEMAYELTDILFISSRLDPLPNVAIDAMAYEIPVVCFDRATGIADALHDGGVGEHCVAPYLDVEEAARRIVRLIDDAALRHRIGADVKALGSKLFDMEAYVESLERLALTAAKEQAHESLDCQVIVGGNGLRIDFFAPPAWGRVSGAEAVRAYVRSWATGVDQRKPCPGFHPGIYRDKHPSLPKHRDPFAHFIESGEPRGAWLCDVIVPSIPKKTGIQQPLTALHIHAYYPELVADILERLKGQDITLDIFVSVPSQMAGDTVSDLLERFGWTAASLDVVPNRGRDIGPLLTQYRRLLYDNYEFVGHVHTKKSADVKDESVGQRWLHFLLENLIGGRHSMATCILNRMAEDDKIGLVFPDEPFIVGWGDNKGQAETLSKSLGIAELPDTHLWFPVGTMFWARTAALAPLFELDLDWGDYPEEPVPYDGTMLHALERIIPSVAEATGFRFELTNVPEVTR